MAPGLLPAVLAAFARLGDGADLVLVEGAGSPAEVNLRKGDIANMGFAEAAVVPVVLIGDIERGGVIAQLVGTCALLSDSERALLAGYIVNKFRGDIRLFDGGIAAIGARTGLRSFGVVPFFPRPPSCCRRKIRWPSPRRNPHPLPSGQGEAPLPQRGRSPHPTSPEGGEGDRRRRSVKIAVPVLPRIANFDDLDPLRAEPGVELVMVRPGRPLPRDAALVILPGSKATLADLEFLRREGWDIDILAHRRQGGRILGLCGGYQMLGRTIADPLGVEGRRATAAGARAARHRYGAGRRQAAAIGRRRRARHRDAGRRLRDASRGDDRAGAGAADAEAGGPRRRCGQRRWPRRRLLSARPLRRRSRSAAAFWHGSAPLPAISPMKHQVEATLDALADHLERHLDLVGAARRGAAAPAYISRLKWAASQAPSTRPPSSRQASL